MLDINWAATFQNMPPELATLLIGMIPIAELRGAIPVALVSFDLPVWSAYLWAVVGNMIPVVFLLLYLESIAQWLSKRGRIFQKFFDWLFARTRRKFSSGVQKYGLFLALTIFVAIPLPVTGAWTGAAAAFLFGMPFRRAFLAILLGVLIAGVIVTLTTIGIQSVT